MQKAGRQISLLTRPSWTTLLPSMWLSWSTLFWDVPILTAGTYLNILEGPKVRNELLYLILYPSEDLKVQWTRTLPCENSLKTGATYWEQIGGKFSEHSSKQKFSENLVKKSTRCSSGWGYDDVGLQAGGDWLLLKRKCCSLFGHGHAPHGSCNQIMMRITMLCIHLFLTRSDFDSCSFYWPEL